MNAEIVIVANPQKTALGALIFLLIFCPGFLGGALLLMKRLDVEQEFQLMFSLCGIIVSIIAILITLKIISSKGHQEWKLTGGRLVYNSPTSLLGKSFDVAWRDVTKVYTPDDGDFARCDLVNDSYVEFHIGERSGWEFFNSIKRIKAEQDGAPTP
jgi:hypothetical protein